MQFEYKIIPGTPTEYKQEYNHQEHLKYSWLTQVERIIYLIYMYLYVSSISMNIYIRCFACISVRLQKASNRLNRSGPKFVWDLT